MLNEWNILYVVSLPNVCMCTSRQYCWYPVDFHRWDMTFPLNHYKDVCSIQSLNRHAMSQAAREKLGVKTTPALLNIALDHVLLDQLHLLLRITDAISCKIWSKWLIYTNFLQNLVKAVRKCSNSFSVWEIKEENAARSKIGGYDWTSLMGRDKRRLLKVELLTHRLIFMVLNKIFSNLSSFLQRLPTFLIINFSLRKLGSCVR